MIISEDFNSTSSVFYTFKTLYLHNYKLQCRFCLLSLKVSPQNCGSKSSTDLSTKGYPITSFRFRKTLSGNLYNIQVRNFYLLEVDSVETESKSCIILSDGVLFFSLNVIKIIFCLLQIADFIFWKLSLVIQLTSFVWFAVKNPEN